MILNMRNMLKVWVRNSNKTQLTIMHLDREDTTMMTNNDMIFTFWLCIAYDLTIWGTLLFCHIKDKIDTQNNNKAIKAA